MLHQQLNMDFAVYWAAHHVPDPYDVDALRSVLEQTLSRPLAAGRWPYPYPPTFLLLTSWFRLLPFGLCYLAWSVLSGGALTAAARHRAAPLLLLSPWVILPVMGGQTPVIMAALVFGALCLRERPWVAGVLLGIAACIKPQLTGLVGLGLLISGGWRQAAAAAATGLTVAGASIAVYGVDAWIAWFATLPKMAAFTATIHPHLDLPYWPLKLAAFLIGGAITWQAFRSSDDPATRMVAATTTSLLCLPHSLWYNAAMLAPVVPRLLERSQTRGVAVIMLMLSKPASTLVMAALALAANWQSLPFLRRLARATP